MNVQCFVCKKTVDRENACKVVVAVSSDQSQRQEQVLYCHAGCLRRLLGSGAVENTPPFTGQPRGAGTIQDALEGARADFAPEDEALVEALFSGLVRDLERYGETAGVWEKLLAYPRGRWAALAELCSGDNPVYRAIEALDPFLKPREDILVAWVDDYYNRSRPFENNRLVLVALDNGYTRMRQIVIPLERPDRPNPGLIP